jgi:tetratricopeptide (TPR) repeat protein
VVFGTTTAMPGRIVVLAALAAALLAPRPARAQQPAAAADAAAVDAGPPPDAAELTGPDAKAAVELLQKIEAGGGDRMALAAELEKLAPRAIDGLHAFLRRPHTVPLEQRRAVLVLVKASVPDDKGKFADPGRLAAAQVREDEKFDWLAELAKLDPATPGVGEVIADVAALRALASTRDIRAAAVILDVGFAAETMVYRDECGRRLRAMAPYSIPALTIASQSREPARRRYATYQLERLDRQDPAKALQAASGDEDLRIAILDAFRTSRHREAVHAVLATINDEAPRVRVAARRAWLGYVTGKAPPPAPKKKLQLPGGKLAEEETALWLTYRELADADLRKLAGTLFGEEYGEKERVDLEALSKRIFSHYDKLRAERDAALFVEAKAKAEAGDLEAATVVFDQLLAQDPERAERADMAVIYFDRAKVLEKAEDWVGASAAYSKAHGLAPEAPHAKDALAAHYYTLGKALEKAGKDGSADFRRAVELRPDYAPAKEAVAAVEDSGLSWLLYAAGLAAVGAVVLLGVGLSRRKTA